MYNNCNSPIAIVIFKYNQIYMEATKKQKTKLISFSNEKKIENEGVS